MASALVPNKSRVFSYIPNKETTYQDIDLPNLKDGEICINIEATCLNPIDLSFIFGKSRSLGAQIEEGKPYPLGFEGCGVVIAGQGPKAESLKGKRVAAMGKGGFFGNHIVIDQRMVVQIPEDIPKEKAASILISPMTSLMFLDIARKNNVRAAVNTAGNSVVGRIVNRLFKKNNIPLINIVRKSSKVEEMKKNEGAEYVLNSNEENFESQYKELAEQLKVNVVFACVSAELDMKLLNLSPPKTKVFIYGMLEDNVNTEIDLRQIFLGKSLDVAWVFNWFKELSDSQKLEFVNQVKSEINSTFQINTLGTYYINDIDKGIQKYKDNLNSNQSINGKVIFLAK